MEKIWEKLAKHPKIGPEKVAKIRGMIGKLEGAWTFIKDVQERGMAAIWDKISEKLSNLWNTVLDAVKNWIMEKVITQISVKLLSMLDPTGIMAVVNSCIALFKAIQSFIKYLRQMLEIVNSFVEGVAEIATENITKAAEFLERTLARGIPIVIGFLANQLSLSGIGKRIGEIIGKVRDMVDKALEWLVNKAVDAGGKLLDMGKSAVGAVLGWLGLRKVFTMENGESHTLSLAKSGSKAQLMMESAPTPLLTFIEQFLAQPNLPANKLQAGKEAKNYALSVVNPAIEKISSAPEGADKTTMESDLLNKMVELTGKISSMVGREKLSDHVDKYLLEGAAGNYESIPKPKSDELTADHVPQNAIFQLIMELGVFEPDSNMAKHAKKRTDKGYAMNEHKIRHMAGRTWGPKGSATKSNFKSVADQIVKTNSKPEAKKNALVEAAKTEKNEDIKVLKNVYNKGIDDPVWQDVKNLPVEEKDKEDIRTRIKGQADAGLSLMESQPLDALKN
jgi:hypothetical protein